MTQIRYKTVIIDIDEGLTIPSKIAEIIDRVMNKCLENLQKEWKNKNYHNIKISEKSIEKIHQEDGTMGKKYTYLISFFYEIL